ncbi:acylphosphatase [Pasteurellaceae bacterium Pebbles2]|nr:acylphosphatase [Pasteurellaceae bacterium Pebbles2]
MLQRQFTIYGRVQGVAFRFFTLQQANKLGVLGYVKNLIDGAVLVVAQGSESQLSAMEEWLHQGSPSAKVERVIAQDISISTLYTKFIIER